MAESNIESKMKNLNLNQKTDINILLLGSTGVGKSTMINSIANYLTYDNLKQAKKDKLMVLIPSNLNIMDKHGIYHLISTGDTDVNEYLQTGESATQDVKTYVFPIWNGQVKIRLIDTPGMGDTRGIKQDDINSENILSYISNLQELHAICFLLKPNESRNTFFFKYCIDQIFSRLDKSASDNIIFCFTNSRGTDYTPGETVGVLRKTVEEIGNRPPFAKIPFDKNVFCFDNEPYRYLAAIKNGLEISSDVKQRNKDSWEKSAAQCWKLIKYIKGDKDQKPLKPHYVKSTNAINEARRMIIQLSQPLAEIMQLIHHNMAVLTRHKELLDQDYASVEEMKSQLFIPVISLEVTYLDHPATVCTAKKCAEVITIAGKNCWNYKQRCHPHCYLTNVSKEIVGDTNLIYCQAMNGKTTCSQCFCDFRIHMHVYYTTKKVEKKEKDKNMQMKITNRTELMANKEKLIENIEQKQKELTEEHKIIVENCAKFAHFLQNNAITPFSDSYKEYIEYLIDREKCLGKVCDKETVDYLQQLLNQYVEIKNGFDEALRITKTVGRDELISPKEISDSIQLLYKLKHNGQKIRELYNCQNKARNKEFQNMEEYVHEMSFKPTEKKDDKKEKKQRKYDGKKDKNDYNEIKKDRSEKKSDDKEKKSRSSKTNVGGRHRQQFRGRANNSSPPPSYYDVQQNQRAFTKEAGVFSHQFNQGGSQYPNFPQHGNHFQQMNQFVPGTSFSPQQFPPQGQQFPPQGQQFPPQGQQFPHQGQQFPPQELPFSSQGRSFPHNQHFNGSSSDRSRREFHINVSVQSPNDDIRSSNNKQMDHPNIPSLMSQNFCSPNLDPRLHHKMNNHNFNQQRDFNWQNHSGFRNNEQGVRTREFRGRGGVNKRTRGKKGKSTNNPRGNARDKNEKTVSKKEKEDNSSSSSDSSDSSSSSSSSSSD